MVWNKLPEYDTPEHRALARKVAVKSTVLLKNENNPKSKIAHTKMKDADLIIVDEMMYLPIDASDIVMLYRSIMYFNQARSFIFITNRRLEEWTDTNEDKHTMETFTERLMNGSRILMLSKK